jgi:hypothetical protein
MSETTDEVQQTATSTTANAAEAPPAKPEPPPLRPPAGRFVRRLPGANLSLEINTERVPAADVCYILQDDRVIFDSPEYPVALEEYQRLCAEYWERMLDDADRETRLRAARGLYQQDATHPRALAILRSDGNPRDRRLLDQASQRSAAANRRAATQRIR